MSSFRILSLDGGGIRGIYTAILIKRILEKVPNFLDETIFLAGTSTGSMLAMGLAYGIPAAEMIEIFRAYAKEVLETTIAARVGQVVGAKYDIMNMRKILTPYLGAAVLKDFLTIRQKYVLVPTFDLDGMIDDTRTWKPKFFHNFPGSGSDEGEMAVDVVLRSSATPIYFSSYQGYIDGSVVALNPSMAALAQALSADGGKQKTEDIRLLSISTGYYPRYLGGRSQDWGYSRWAKPLINIVLDGEMGVNSYYCMQVLGADCYYRLAPLLPESIGLYDAEAIPLLVQYAQEVNIAPTVEWIEKHYLDPKPEENDGQDAPESIGIKVHKSEYVRSPGG